MASPPPPTDRRAPARPGRRGSGWELLALPLVAFLALPLVALLWRTSPAAALAALGRPEVGQAIRLSLQTSLVATALAVVAGTPLALVLARRTFPFKRLVETLVDLPVVLPPAVAGVALLMAFGRRGIVGAGLDALGLPLSFTAAAVVLAQTFVAAPHFVRAAASAFAAVAPELADAARIDGAGPVQLLRHVLLPMARTGLLGGALLTWARALGEFGATIIFAGNLPGRTQTMPLAIYLGFELELDVALALSVVLLGSAFAALVAARALLRS